MPPPVFDAPMPPPAAVDADGPIVSEAGMMGAFVQDPAFASALPTFDDFRARDEQAAAQAQAAAAALGARADRRYGASSPAVPPAAPPTPQEAVQERIMELLKFDTIDDRPMDEPEYDYTARIIGRGLPNKAGAYPLPYLQSGHMLLVGVLLLCSLISYPGFPLTTVPAEYRGLLLQGLGITYLFNAACAVYARGIAEAKQEPVAFWTVKVFLLGGLALGELSEAVPMPQKPRTGRGAGR